MKTKNLVFACVLVLCSYSIASAQITFQKTYGTSDPCWANSVRQTSDGGYIMVGGIQRTGTGLDVYVVKTNSVGDTLWTKILGAFSDEQAYCVKQTSDGDYIVAGLTNSFGAGSSDVYLIKIKPNGVVWWTKSLGTANYEMAHWIEQTSNGGYIISGRFTNSTAISDVYLLRTDASGNAIWSQTYGGISDDDGYSVQRTSDLGYIIVGATNSSGSGLHDVYVIKTDSLGNVVWDKTYGGAGEDYGLFIRQTTDGGYIICGHTDSFSSGAGSADVYLIKTDAAGVVTWSKAFGGTQSEYGNQVQQTSDGGYIIAGGSQSFSGGFSDVYAIKTDASGTLMWSKIYGGTVDDAGYGVQQTTDGGYIIGGYTESYGSGFSAFYLIKTDANGNSNCNESTPTTLASIPPTITTIPAFPALSLTTLSASTTTMITAGSTVSSLCLITSVPETPAALSLSLYPNPTADNFTLAVSAEFTHATLQIFNTLGAKVYEQNINQASTVISLDVPAGIYLVKVNNGDKIFTAKLIMQ